MTDVFVSYRSTDYALVARFLQIRLKERFGQHRVFYDRVSMVPSTYYPSAIEQALDRTHALVVMIDPQWLSAVDDSTGARAIDREDDWVRHEIRTALQRNILVIPVLWTPKGCAPTRMVTIEELPADISRLAQCQAFEIQEDRLDADLDNLCDVLTELVPSLRATASRPSRCRQRLWPWSRAATPAMLGILAGMIVAVAWLPGTGQPSGSDSSTSPNGGAGTPQASASPASTSPRRTSEIALQRGGADLEAQPALNRPSIGDPGTAERTGASATVIAWNGVKSPTREECSAHVATAVSDISVLDPPHGAYLCIRTDDGRIAVARYQGITRDGLLTFAVTVWNQ